MQDEYAVPEEVKAAQVENALGIIDGEYLSRRSAELLCAAGVIPETPPGTVVETPQKPLSSVTAERLLSGWTGAGRL